VASAQLARPGLAQHSMATLGTGAALLVPQPGLARLAAAMASTREGGLLGVVLRGQGWHGQGPGAAEEGLAEAT
jgi:hypothetical protein